MSKQKKSVSESSAAVPATAKGKDNKQPSNSGKKSTKGVSGFSSQRVWPD